MTIRSRNEPTNATLSRRSLLKNAGGAAGVLATASLAGCVNLRGDHATYWSDSRQLDIDYEAVVAAARDAGYDVTEPYYVNDTMPRGHHPEGLAQLDQQLGPDYRVFGFTFFFTDDVFLECWLSGDVPTASLLDNRGPSDEVPMDAVPPREWLAERFALAFDVTDDQAREYAANISEQVATGADIPRVEVDHPVTFARVYDWLESERTAVSSSDTGGDGWYKETSVRDGQQFATVDFVVQSAAVRHRDRNRTYTLKLDRLGGLNLQIRLPVGEEIPEEEYRGVFRQLFADVGLPPAVVDDLTFEYEPSVW
jgi:hypothetical protein